MLYFCLFCYLLTFGILNKCPYNVCIIFDVFLLFAFVCCVTGRLRQIAYMLFWVGGGTIRVCLGRVLLCILRVTSLWVEYSSYWRIYWYLTAGTWRSTHLTYRLTMLNRRVSFNYCYDNVMKQ